MALFFLLVVFGFVILLIVAFVFPPTKWVQKLSAPPKDQAKPDGEKKP
jgi:hypothetical protein